MAFRRLERMVWAQQQFAGAGAGAGEQRHRHHEPAEPSLENAYAVLNVLPESSNASANRFACS